MTIFKTGAVIVALIALILSTIGKTIGSPLLLNVTPSEPEGLYAVASARSGDFAIGAFVAACPPQTAVTEMGKRRGYLESGPCPGGFIRVLKQIVAMPGDLVMTTPVGIRVNGRLLPNTAPLYHDEKNRSLVPYTYGTYRVPSGEFWLASTHAIDSFDGRYFGPVNRNDIEAIVTPIWTTK